ncbi:MAG: septal ring lytic transglycosylase RlpA family protein [Pseudomonadota bacterium]|nr:septal ring lytic transglycosylase RlpA family protein [Pseudomonadota bacterium]
MINFDKLLVLTVLFLTSCSQNNTSFYNQKIDNPYYGGVYKVGNPYEIGDTLYFPTKDYNYEEMGVASWYGKKFHGKLTSNGERYDMNRMTAAHKTLPLPTKVKVTNLENNKSVILRVNDRGPFVKNRVIDVSMRAAERLGFKEKGTAKVMVRYFSEAPVYDKYGNLLTKKNKMIKKSGSYSPQKKLRNKNYSLLIGSFQDKKNIENIMNKLEGFGGLAVEKNKVNGKTLYKIILGPYKSITFVNRIKNEVLKKGIKNTKILTLDYGDL